MKKKIIYKIVFVERQKGNRSGNVTIFLQNNNLFLNLEDIFKLVLVNPVNAKEFVDKTIKFFFPVTEFKKEEHYYDIDQINVILINLNTKNAESFRRNILPIFKNSVKAQLKKELKIVNQKNNFTMNKLTKKIQEIKSNFSNLILKNSVKTLNLENKFEQLNEEHQTLINNFRVMKHKYLALKREQPQEKLNKNKLIAVDIQEVFKKLNGTCIQKNLDLLEKVGLIKKYNKIFTESKYGKVLDKGYLSNKDFDYCFTPSTWLHYTPRVKAPSYTRDYKLELTEEGVDFILKMYHNNAFHMLKKWNKIYNF